jgi:hypothetical protein
VPGTARWGRTKALEPTIEGVLTSLAANTGHEQLQQIPDDNVGK